MIFLLRVQYIFIRLQLLGLYLLTIEYIYTFTPTKAVSSLTIEYIYTFTPTGAVPSNYRIYSYVSLISQFHLLMLSGQVKLFVLMMIMIII